MLGGRRAYHLYPFDLFGTTASSEKPGGGVRPFTSICV